MFSFCTNADSNAPFCTKRFYLPTYFCFFPRTGYSYFKNIAALKYFFAILKADLPDFDEETGVLHEESENEDEDLEIELVEEEAPFLRGYGKMHQVRIAGGNGL